MKKNQRSPVTNRRNPRVYFFQLWIAALLGREAVLLWGAMTGFRTVAAGLQPWTQSRPSAYPPYQVILPHGPRTVSLDLPGLFKHPLSPIGPDSKLKQHKRTQLDSLYQKIVDDLDELLGVVGLKAA